MKETFIRSCINFSIKFVMIEFIFSLILSYLQKYAADNMQSIAIIMMMLLLFKMHKDNQLNEFGLKLGNEYERSQWEKYEKLDIVSREKSTIHEFKMLVDNGSKSRNSIASWGIRAGSSTLTSITSLIYIMITLQASNVIIMMIFNNFCWYFLITKYYINYHDKCNDQFRKIKRINDNLSLLYGIRINNFEPVLDFYMYCKTEINNKMAQKHTLFTKIIYLQQIPIYGTLFVIPYLISDKTIYPFIIIMLNNLTATLNEFIHFNNFFDEMMRDLVNMDNFWQGKIIRTLPIQQIIPDNITVQISLPHINVNGKITIKKGKRYLIRGYSGCGKTSLIRAIMGHVDGAKIYESSIIKPNLIYWDKIVYMKQSIREATPVISPTIRQLFYDCPDKQLIIKCLGLTNADYWLNKTMNNNIDDPICERISGGEKTRLCFAIILYQVITKNPQILILDEPEQGMDQSQCSMILENIYKTFPNLTIIIITHLCDCEINKLKIDEVWQFKNKHIISSKFDQYV